MSINKDYLIWALLAGLGGLVRFLSSSILDKDAAPMSRGRFIFLMAANVTVSGFSGMMGALMMSTVTPDTVWQHVAAGIFGFLGAKGIEMLSEKVNNKIV